MREWGVGAGAAALTAWIAQNRIRFAGRRRRAVRAACTDAQTIVVFGPSRWVGRLTTR